MKKINVSEERCIGCGACVAIDSQHFEFNEEGKSSVITSENLESENLVNAIESCPTSAIEMIEEQDETAEKEVCDSCCEKDECNCEEECECSECDCDECKHQEMEEEN